MSTTSIIACPKCRPKLSGILTLLTRGYRFKELADELGISVQSVNTHLRNIYEKLQVRSRVEAVLVISGIEFLFGYVRQFKITLPDRPDCMTSNPFSNSV